MESIVKSKVAPSDGVILDVGCGTGRYAVPLVQNGYQVIGLDASFQQLQNAPPELRTVCSSCVQIPLASHSICCVYTVLMIHQLQPSERKQFFSECRRVLTNSGTLLIKTCSHNDLRKRPLSEYFPSSLGINMGRYPDIPEICLELKAAGFTSPTVIPTHTQVALDSDDLLRSIEKKHNTTLSLIPQEEFAHGVEMLRKAVGEMGTFVLDHYHTILVASCEE